MNNAKDFLNRAYILSQRIKKHEQMLIALREAATDISPHFSETKVQTSAPCDSKMAMIVAIIVDLERKLEKEKAALKSAAVEIAMAIEGIADEDIRYVLSMRYLMFRTWTEIAQGLYVSERTVFRLHRKGLEKLAVADSR